jgi:hypothetical protein
MEYRKRTISSAMDESTCDNFNSYTLYSSDINDYTDYHYNGNFNLFNIIFNGVVDLFLQKFNYKIEQNIYPNNSVF